jgi:hypothetical protein
VSLWSAGDALGYQGGGSKSHGGFVVGGAACSALRSSSSAIYETSAVVLDGEKALYR